MPDSVADEMAYVLEHAEVTVAVVEDQEQVDKIISVADRLSRLSHIVYDEPRGLRDYDHARLKSFTTTFRSSAARNLPRDPDALARGRARSTAARAATSSVILYTSGTTGRPKGVMLTFENLIVSVHNGNLVRPDRRR